MSTTIALILAGVAILLAAMAVWIVRSLTQAIGGLQTEVRAEVERIGSLERRQAEVAKDLSDARAAVTEGTTLTRSLTSSTEALRKGLAGAQDALSALRAQDEERLRQLTDATASVRRLEHVIAGAQSKGAAGEHIVEQILASLPAEWIERDYPIGGGRVEFALRLPNQLVVPIDSKWPSTALIDQLHDETDPAKLGKLREQVERTVLAKAREVAAYLQPGTTAGYAIAAVPDGVYAVCLRAPGAALRERVAIVSYSLLVPYLLIVVQGALKASTTADLDLLANYLQAATEAAGKLRDEVEGRLSRALTMMENSRDDLRAELANLQANLTGVRQGEARLLAEGTTTGDTLLP